MLQPLLVSILATGLFGPWPEPEPALPSSIAAGLALTAPPPLQDYEYGLSPEGWVSFGISFTSTTNLDVDTVNDPDDKNPIGGEFGLYSWQGDLGLGLEAGLMHSTYEAVGEDVLIEPSEEVDVWRGTVGLRVADRGSGDRFLPWLRAGFLYRFDQGTNISDDGPGFYIGGGFDFALIGGLALSPQLVYQQSKSFDSETWIGTLSLSYLF